MKVKPVLILIVLITLHPLTSRGQKFQKDQQEQFEFLIEQIFPLQDDDLPYEDLYESLFQYFMQPLDLNSASLEELQSLLLLSEPQIQSFFRHIERSGRLLSIYEIQAIPGWDINTIQRILPFVTVSDSGLRKDSRSLRQRINESGKKMLLIRHERILEERVGYLFRSDSIQPAYKGSPDKIYTRMRINRPNDFSFGFTLEKDQGEPIEWNTKKNQWGADFISYHAMLYEQGRLKKIVLGDFQLQYGQSLVFGSGFNIGKGAETVTTIRRSNIGLRPYTSVLESGFFRGMGMTYELKPGFEATVFYSSSARDAIVSLENDSIGSGPGYFSSLQSSGFHRTEREISAKAAVREKSTGGALHYKSKNKRFQIGATSLFSKFSHHWTRRPPLYQRFNFQGKENFTASIFSEYSWQNLHLFSEIARSTSGGMGIVAGSMIALNPQLDFAFLARKYDPHFHSFYSTGFGEGSQTTNETGLYWGIKFQPKRELSFNAYFDRFYFPWLRYRVDAPSDGYEYLLRVNYQPKKTLLLYGQFREEVKDLNSTLENWGRIPLPGSKKNYLLNLDYSPMPNFNFRSRVQWSSYRFQQELTKGYAIVQDVNWQIAKFKISSRIALFDTEDYTNRQFVFEKDVLWAFSIPAYNGQGIRNYLLINYKLNKYINMWLRWARTHYTDREQISSGNERIEGSSINQFKAQVRVMW